MRVSWRGERPDADRNAALLGDNPASTRAPPDGSSASGGAFAGSSALIKQGILNKKPFVQKAPCPALLPRSFRLSTTRSTSFIS